MMGSTAVNARPTRGWFRLTARALAVLVALQFVLMGLLVVGQTVPDKPIVDNLLSAIKEGTYGPSAIPDRMGTQSDTFTECVVVGTGLGADPEESARSRAARMPRIGNCDGGAADVKAVAAGKVFTDMDYYKYWAGYTVFTRPVLAVAGMDGLRIASGTLMIACLLGAFLAVRARTSTAVATGLLLPLVAGTNMLSTPSTSFSQSISIAFILLSVVLTAVGAGRSRYLGLIGAVVGAGLFCYVDLLTTPAIPWALSAFTLAAAVWYGARDLRAAALWGVLGAVGWGFAFAFTWVSRWVFGAAFLGFDRTVAMVKQNVGFRTSGNWAGVSDAFGAGVTRNVSYWWAHVPTSHLVLTGCVLAVLVGLLLAARRGGIARWGVAAVLSLPAAVVPFWYTAVSNHSQIHAFFVNRGVPAVLAVVTAACLLAAARPRVERAPAERAEGAGDDAAARDDRALLASDRAR
nr:hypothetical protein [Kocuria rhizophila]